MHVIGFCGYSGSGKTTLVEQLIVRLRLAGQRVSVVKHAHHEFDIDHEGKDSWRHRQAGAFEVVIASNRRLAKIREFPALEEPTTTSWSRSSSSATGSSSKASSTRRCRRSKSGAQRPASRRSIPSTRS